MKAGDEQESLLQNATADPEEGCFAREYHIKRHAILLFVIFVFVSVGMVIVLDDGRAGKGVCHKARETSQDGSWQLRYISEKIAECKNEGFDLGGSSILPWLTVLLFPFIMVQFQFTYDAIVRETPTVRKNTHTRADEDAPNPVQKKTFCGAIDDLPWIWMLVVVLESLCVGGYLWLINYNHTGPHRRWHGISTAILFLCATILNIILCVKFFWYHHHKFPDHNPFKYVLWWTVTLISFLQGLSVILFLFAFMFQSENANDQRTIVMEYIVACVWFVTILVDSFLYWHIRNYNTSPKFSEWCTKLVGYYCLVALLGFSMRWVILAWIDKT